MNYYTVLHKSPKNDKVGIIAVDMRGSIYYVGQKSLIPMLTAFLEKTRTLERLIRKDKSIIKQQVEPSDQEVWINEFRRQVPAPYWGAQSELYNGQLESVRQTYQQESPDADFTERRF